MLYFTNRLEIGTDSVYEKLEVCSHPLNGTMQSDGTGNENDDEEMKGGASWVGKVVKDAKFNVLNKFTTVNESTYHKREQYNMPSESSILGYPVKVRFKGLD